MKIAIAFACALVVSAAGCKKKETAVSTDVPPPAPAPAPAPPLSPLPGAKPGPLYVSIQYGGVLRLDAEGWKKIGNTGYDVTRIELGVDDTLWAYSDSGSGLWRFNGTGFDTIPFTGRITGIVGAAEQTLWVIADGELRHLVGETWTTEVVPGGDPPRGIAPAPGGVWVRTLDRTYRYRDQRWEPVDVPGVTGAMVDIVSLDSDGSATATLVTTVGVMAFDGTTWKLTPKRMDPAQSEGSWIHAGPQGRFVLNAGNGARLIGDSSYGARPIDVSSLNIPAERLTLMNMDAAGRTWAVAGSEIVVLDPAGKGIKRWRSEEAPLLTAMIVGLEVSAGGPTHLVAGERATGTVTGKVEGSAAGMKVITCSQGQEYGKEPCAGVTTARTTQTVAGGRFTLDDVAIGVAYFWVQRSGRWRRVGGKVCCTELAPDTTFDLGTLTFADP